MARGIFFTSNGKVYQTSTAEAKKLLKAVIKGEEGVTPAESDELAPVIALDGLTKEAAEKMFLKIEMGT